MRDYSKVTPLGTNEQIISVENSRQNSRKNSQQHMSQFSTLKKSHFKNYSDKEVSSSYTRHKYYRTYKSLRRVMLVIKACMYLNGIQKNVKLYGTSSDIYDLTTRNYRFVKEQLYPDLTSTKLKKSKSFYVATTFFSRSIGHNLPFPLIHPDSTLKSVWTLVFLVAIIYTVSLMPYVVVFYEDPSKIYEVIDLIILWVFYIDLIICLFSSYYDKDGNLVTSRKTVMVSYLKGWFILDIISCFPFEEILNAIESNHGTVGFFKLAKIPRLYKIMRINRIFKIFKYLEQDQQFFTAYLNINSGVSKLLQIIVLALIFLHLFGCIWYFIATLDPDQSWFQLVGREDKSYLELYQLSVYYGLTIVTTIGYGNIHAVNSIEYLYSTFAFFFGAAFYSIFTGILSTVFNNLYMKENHINYKVGIAEQICEQYNVRFFTQIDQVIFKKMIQAINNNYNYSALKLIDETNLYQELPLNLQYDLFMNFHDAVMQRIDFFHQCKDKKFIVRIATQLKAYKYRKNEPIWSPDEVPDSIYFMPYGRVQFQIKYAKLIEKINPKNDLNGNKFSRHQNFAFKKMVPGSYFGESDVIHNRLRYYSAICESKNCQLYFLTQTDFKFIVKMEFPHIVKQLEQIAEKREKNHIAIFKKIYNYLKNRSQTVTRKTSYWKQKLNEQRLKRKNSLQIQTTPFQGQLKRSLSYPLLDKETLQKIENQSLMQLNYQNQYIEFQYKSIQNQFSFMKNDLRNPIYFKNLKNQMVDVQQQLNRITETHLS